MLYPLLKRGMTTGFRNFREKVKSFKTRIMQKSSLLNELTFSESKPSIKLLLETEHTKEIRICLVENQEMKEHQTPYPIVIEIVKGEIDFGVNGEKHRLSVGDIVSLDGGIPHDLFALESSIIRLSLSKKDDIERVRNVNN